MSFVVPLLCRLRGAEVPHCSLNLARRLLRVGMLPETKNMPARLGKKSVCVAIPRDIALDLVAPVVGVGGGLPVVVGTPVPEAAVHEDSNA